MPFDGCCETGPTTELYELADSFHIWEGSDDWDITIKRVPGGWMVKESVWAASPLLEEKTYFHQEFYVWQKKP